MFIKQGQRCDVLEGSVANVAKLRLTLRRSRRVRLQCRDFEIQCHDVTESPKSQCRDVEIQHRDVPESVDN